MSLWGHVAPKPNAMTDKAELLLQLEQHLRLIGQNQPWLDLGELDDELRLELAKALITPEQIQATEPVLKAPAVVEPIRLEPQSVPREPNSSKPSLDLSPETAASLDQLFFRIRDCEICALSKTRRTLVFGQGNHKANLMIVGEAPGDEEDKSGLAFVGRAGQLLTQIISSIGVSRDSVFICNTVKCRPPDNRSPSANELEACFPFLNKQIEILKPKLIITLGNVATKRLVPNAPGISLARGQEYSYLGVPVIPIYHPSDLIKRPAELPKVWQDMRVVRQRLFS